MNEADSKKDDSENRPEVSSAQKKWDNAAKHFDLMAGRGAESRWLPHKQALFEKMNGKVLFLALGTGLDIVAFPPNQTISAIDISPKMLAQAEPRIAAYEGSIHAEVMDVHNLRYEPHSFDQIFTSCTFCSVPNPVAGLESLRRVLKPGGEIFMFEHTGSHYYPFKFMMNFMTLLTERVGPAMNRNTVANVQAAGFDITQVEHVFLDVVKIIHGVNPTVT